MSHSGRVLAQPPHARLRPPTPPAPPFPPEWLDARGTPLPVIPYPHVNMMHVFDSNEDVMLDPKIFASAKKTLRFKPSCDLFASASHHQLPRYFAPTSDTHAAGKDAFSICWQQEATPYINPPWSLIPDVLKKIQSDRVKCMFVCPKWSNAAWWPLFERLRLRSETYNQEIYLDSNGKLRPPPSWPTLISILDGSRRSLR